MDNNPELQIQPLNPQTQVPVNPNNLAPEVPKWKQTKFIVIIILVLLILVCGIGGYIYLNKQSISKSSQPNTSQIPTQTQTGKQPTPGLIQSENVEWLSEPQKVDSVGFFNIIDKYYPFTLQYCKTGTDCSKLSSLTDQYEPKTTYYLVGAMKSKYPGGSVYLTISKGLPATHVFKGIGTEKDIVNDAEVLAIFIKTTDGKFILTNDYQNGNLINLQNNQPVPVIPADRGLIYDQSLSLDKAGSQYEYTFTANGSPIKLSINRTNHFFNKSGLFLVKDLGDNYGLYSNQDINSNPIKLKTVISPTFVIRLPTGLVADVRLGAYSTSLEYQKGKDQYNPYSDIAHLNWTASAKPQPLTKIPTDKGIVTDYTAIRYTTDYDGCRGTITLDNASSDAEVLDITNNLEQVGTTDKGDIIYEPKNKDFKIYQSFWYNRVQLLGLGDVLNYNQFLDLKPILIWKNSLGVYRMVFRDDLVSSKCWGEPLIYLYPEKQTNVQIKLSDVINLTESEPRYTDSWNVTAYPNSKIYDSKAERYYPYLYWEGRAPVSSSPVSINVVNQQGVHDYFEKELSTLGLNNKERADFENYWEPKLNDSPYYQISFYDAQELNRIAPLIINPQSTTLIRILMSYERLNEKIDTGFKTNPDYQTPTRKGFTVVEWGGVLHTKTSLTYN